MIRTTTRRIRNRDDRFFSSADAPAYVDQLGVSMTAIWSIRKMTSFAWRAIRVRRSSDSAEQDIGFAGNYLGAPLDSVALLAFVGAGDGFVTKIYDQWSVAGTGFPFTQATTTKQAKIVSAGSLLSYITPDGGDGYAATAVTMGTPYVGMYWKFRMPSIDTTRVLLEQSTNYNINAQSFIMFADSSPSGLSIIQRNTTGGTDLNYKYLTVQAGLPQQMSVLLDRTKAISAETAVYLSDVAQSLSTNGSPADMINNTSTYDLYLFGRAASSLFCDSAAGFDTLMMSNADTSSYRSTLAQYTR